ncbi:MAG: energy transducer TonB [Acetobacteraceae bacterium]|nr:energy transducer TonB [Acetobacteraceae bacterium]
MAPGRIGVPWGVSLAVVVALHAGGWLLLRSASAVAPPVPKAIMLDLTAEPAPAPQPAQATPVAPAPPQPTATPAPEPSPAQVAPAAPPPTSAQPSPEPALPQVPPTQASQPVPTAPPPTSAPPVSQGDDVALPLPPPPPLRPPQPRHAAEPPATRTAQAAALPPPTAPPPAAATPQPAAPQQAAAPPSGQVLTTWQGRLVARLAQFRRFPRAAQLRREQGVVLMRVTLSRFGQVLAMSLARSSGYPDLDGEAQAWIARAEPLPAFPPEMTAPQMELMIPLRFTLQ